MVAQEDGYVDKAGLPTSLQGNARSWLLLLGGLCDHKVKELLQRCGYHRARSQPQRMHCHTGVAPVVGDNTERTGRAGDYHTEQGQGRERLRSMVRVQEIAGR